MSVSLCGMIGVGPSSRTVTPMSYLYAVRFTGPIDPLVLTLRQELFVEPYQSINWPAQRNNVNALDIYNPHHPVLDVAHVFLGIYESLPIPSALSCLPIRSSAIKTVYRQVVYEDENTTYQTLGPVSKVFNMLCRYHHDGPASDAFNMHLSRIGDFLWLSKDGMFMAGTNGSQLWDLAFFAQAAVETGLAELDENKEVCKGMLDWLDHAQIRDNPKHYKVAYRHQSKGAWAFSTPEQSYTVSHEGRPALIKGLGLRGGRSQSGHGSAVA